VSSFTPWPLFPGDRTPCTHWIGWVDPRTGLDGVEERKFLPLPGLELRPLGRPASSQSLRSWFLTPSYLHIVQVAIYLCIYGSAVHGDRFISFLIHTQSTGLLGRGSATARLLPTPTRQQKYRINTQRHPYFEWDLNP
jgi:hypothetical protein